MKPITKEAWDRVHEKALDIVSAFQSDDSTMHATYTAQMMILLDELEANFGEHAMLYDTRADYTDDCATAISLCTKAHELAIEQNDLFTLHEVEKSLASLKAANP